MHGLPSSHARSRPSQRLLAEQASPRVHASPSSHGCPTARAAALLVEARRGERLLDFCAAPGGKSIVLAQQMGDHGEVVACDASPDRLLCVRDNVRRLRLTSIRTHLIQTSDASESDLTRSFDGALVDVPCSNTGVIARRPEARLGLTAQKLE